MQYESQVQLALVILQASPLKSKRRGASCEYTLHKKTTACLCCVEAAWQNASIQDIQSRQRLMQMISEPYSKKKSELGRSGPLPKENPTSLKSPFTDKHPIET